MPKSELAPSQNWDINSQISQSKDINKQNQKEFDAYKAKTEAYSRIDKALKDYEAQGIDTSIYRKKLSEKVPNLSFGDKLGVVGRNIGQDYVKSAAKMFGGNPELTHSQKMDNLKLDREKVINPISTIATDVALDPGTYVPVPFVKGATKLGTLGKNTAVGGVASGGLYTARNAGEEDYKPTDSLIAAGFGGALNGLIATALGKTVPKTTKQAISKKAVKESEPIADEALQDNFIDNSSSKADDNIVNKMMKNKADAEIQPKKESIFGFDKNSTVKDANNYIANGSTQTFGGGAVGGLEAEATQRDYNQDGEHDYKDNLIGALVGAVGVNAAKKLMPKAFKDKNINENTTGMFVGAKPNDKGAFSDIATKKTMREIDDSKIKYSGEDFKELTRGESAPTTKLGFILKHDELYRKYPELKNMKVIFDDSIDGARFNTAKVNGQDYDNVITIGKLPKGEEESALLHEIQHSIQNKEGWARGGSPETSKGMPYKESQSYNNKINELDKEIDDVSKKIFDAEFYDETPNENLVKRKEFLIEELSKTKSEMWAKNTKTKHKQYKSLHGEQQARATQARQNYTPEQRVKEDWTKTLEKTEGKYNEPIIKYDDGIAMMSPVKSATQKEKRGIFNVTFNGKNSSQVKKYDLDALDDFIKYEKGNKNKGAIHIQKHLDDGSVGEVSKQELLSIGDIIRNGKLHLEDGKNVYTLFKNDGTGLRVVTGIKGKSKEKIITFYSDRNLGEGTPSMGGITSTSPSNESITKPIPKSQDTKLYASPTLSGAGVGALTGATNDIDGDGKITYKDLIIGAGVGAGGTKLAIKATDSIYGAKALTKLKKIADTDFVDAFSGHKIYAKKDYMNVREKMISSKNAKMEDFVQLHEQLKLLSDDARSNLHKYISGDTNIKLSDSLKTFADDYTNQIKKQGQELVNLGVLDQAQYDKFKGKYLHRVYEKDLTKSVSQAFKKGKTIPGVHTRGHEWTGTKTEYDKLLQDGKIGDFFSGKIEAKKLNNGQYKFTQDWTKEQRARWGEIEDIAYTLPETLMRMSEMSAHGKMLKDLAQQTHYLSDEALDGYIQLQGKRYGALRDKYVPKDIADDINEFNRAMFGEEDGAIFSKEVKEAYGALSTFWKKSHTVYNPTAHVNNLLSNVTMQYMNGINPVKAIINAKKGAFAFRKLGEFRTLTAKTLVGLTEEETNKLKALTLDDDLNLYIQAEKAGLFGRSKLNDILGQYVGPIDKKSKVPSSLKKIDEVSSKWYQGEDDIMRFSMLKSLVDDGKSFDVALKEVNNTIPDYTKPMSRMARFGRKSMLTPFISWTYYSTPIILRQFKERPGRAIALMGALYGINKAMGIDPYNNKDIPQQNFSMKRIPIYKDGKEITTLKVDRWMPHNDILSPLDFVKNLTNGGAWKGGYEVLNNQNLYYGGKITHNEGARKAYDIFKYGTQQITPDAVDKIWNMAESAMLSKKKRRKHPIIQPRTKTQEALNFLGLNTLTYDKQAQKKKAISEKLK